LSENKEFGQNQLEALTFFGKACDLKNAKGCEKYAKLKRKLGA